MRDWAIRLLTVTLLILLLLLLQTNRWTCTNGIRYVRCVGCFIGGTFENVCLLLVCVCVVACSAMCG